MHSILSRQENMELERLVSDPAPKAGAAGPVLKKKTKLRTIKEVEDWQKVVKCRSGACLSC